MELKELRCFVQVAEKLNFNKAAEQLNMSQPVVTKIIAQLEHKLGVKLFERTTRRVSLTPPGVVLRHEAEGLLGHIDQVQRAVRHAIAEESCRIAIGVTPLALQTVFPAIIRDFKAAYPNVDVAIHELPTDAQVTALLSAKIDAAFLLMPAADPSLEVKVLHTEHMRLAVPVAHPHLKTLKGAPMPLSAFAGDTFVIPTRTKNPGVHDEIIRACAVSGFRPKVKDCTEGQSCLFFVEAGMGVSFVTSQQNATNSNNMQIVELAAPSPSLTVAFAWRRDDPSPYVTQLASQASLFTSVTGADHE